MKRTTSSKAAIGIVLAIFTITFNAASQESDIFDFTTETGSHYDSRLVSEGTFLFGCKYDGDIKGNGSVFRIKSDGTDYQIIHTFSNSTEGANPVGSLVLSGTTLFGVTVFGGNDNLGTIFSIETDGTGFKKLFDFNSENGALPYSTLIVSGDELYGISQQGGNHGYGLVFKLKTDGTGFTALVHFDGNNGANPVGSLALSNDTLYGLTYYGGVNNSGVMYSINTDGSGYKLLKSLDVNSGVAPSGGFVIEGNILFALTGYGGSEEFGTLIQINKDGTNFKLLRNFGPVGGGGPRGTMTIYNSVLYGYAGNSVFKINSDGTDFSIIKEFSFYNEDGRDPLGQLLVENDKLYGHIRGGKYNYGVIFNMNLDGSSYAKLIDFQSTNTGYDPRGSQVFLGSKLYGVTRSGGTYNQGIIYSVDTLGENYSVIHSFDGSNGATPESLMTQLGNRLYGTTLMGGSDYSYSGVLFSLDTTNFTYTSHINFTGISNGSFPVGPLVADNGNLYGMTSYGGIENKGTIFEFDTTTKLSKILFAFQNTDATIPYGGLTISNNKLYGQCLGGVGDGIVFSVNVDGTGFTKLLDLSSVEGGRYGNSIVLSGDTLFVSSKQGGIEDNGVLVMVKIDGTGFKKLHDFVWSTGSNPEGDLIVTENEIYGMVSSGGPENSGAAFKINKDGSEYTLLFEFDNDSPSTNGRITGSNSITITKGSLSLNNDQLFGAVSSMTGETTSGRILKYSIKKTIDEVLSVSDNLEDKYFRIYPNPSSDIISLQLLPDHPSGIKIIDAQGRTYSTPKLINDSVNISHLPSGFYVLIVGAKRFSFIKQ